MNIFLALSGLPLWIGLLLAEPIPTVADSKEKPKEERTMLILSETAQVQSDQVLLRHVLAGPVDAALGNVALGASPSLSKERTLRRSDIDVALQRAFPEARWAWSGAEQCTLSRPASELSENDLQSLIKAALTRFTQGDGEIQIVKIIGYSSILVPKENVTTNVELVSPNINSRFGTVSLNVDFENRCLARRDVRFEWEWKRPVWVAQESQKAGNLQPEDFVLESRSILNLPSEPLPSSELPRDLLLIRPVPKGEPLLVSNVKIPIAVARGSAVTASVRSGTMLVSINAIALENGSIGQTIRLQNPSSRKELIGKVVQPNNVEVIP
jgi:flagella basal body P-ring formation protein FlgA